MKRALGLLLIGGFLLAIPLANTALAQGQPAFVKLCHIPPNQTCGHAIQMKEGTPGVAVHQAHFDADVFYLEAGDFCGSCG